MKNLFTPLFAILALSISSLWAQTPVTVSMGAAYSNNIWYNLQTGEVGSAQAVNNWDIALAATSSPSGALTSSVLFNPKRGIVCVVPGTTPANFSSADTTGMTWTPLYNDDENWTTGAFNQPSAGGLDYGFGSYNISTHNIEANRVFVVRYGTPGNYSCIKLHLTLNSVAGTYTLVYDLLNNSDPHTETLSITPYNTKNFLYYSFASHAVVDREPAASEWDLLFTQYITTSELYQGSANQLVGGVLHNHGLQSSQTEDVDQASYNDHEAQAFSNNINTIGWDWKYLNESFAWEVEDERVYFVKRKNGDIWKLYFTSFGGTSNGNFNFTKEKVYTATTGLFEASAKASMSIYPNPANEGKHVNILFHLQDSDASTLHVQDLAGNTLYHETLTPDQGLNTHRINTASLQPGMYIVTVQSKNTIAQEKLVIK